MTASKQTSTFLKEDEIKLINDLRPKLSNKFELETGKKVSDSAIIRRCIYFTHKSMIR